MLLNYRNIRNSGNINIGIPIFEALLETYPVPTVERFIDNDCQIDKTN